MTEQAEDKNDRDAEGSATDKHDDSGAPKQAEAKGDDDDKNSDKPKKESALKKPWVRLALVVVVIVVVIALLIYFINYERRGKFLQSTNDAMLDANIVNVAPQVTGYIVKIFVDDNQIVKAGQPLLQIDDRDYQSQIAQYRAQVEEGLANADNYRAQVREQQATVAQNRQEYLSSLANAHYQESEARRYAPLAATGAETKEKAAQYAYQAQAYRHTADADYAQIVAARRKIASLQAQVRQALAQAKSAQAQVDAADVNNSLTLLRAAVDGKVGNKTVHVGQFVQSGTNTMSLVPLDGLFITANFKETQMGIMRPGQPATFTVDALSGVKLNGHVLSTSPGTGAQFSLIPPQNATGNFTKIVQRVPVKIAVDAGPEARKVLVPGLSVNVTVDTISAKRDMHRIKDEEKQRRDQDQQDEQQRRRTDRYVNP